jgi:sulfur relay (sulfurtransferase) DsrF/TusC family protein
MPPSIVLVIREDPAKSPRAVEALRIALGLGAGENPLTVVLLDEAPLLLAENTDDVLDVDILEKYRPSLAQLGVPFIVPVGARARHGLDPSFTVEEVEAHAIARVVAQADRVLIF